MFHSEHHLVFVGHRASVHWGTATIPNTHETVRVEFRTVTRTFNPHYWRLIPYAVPTPSVRGADLPEPDIAHYHSGCDSCFDP